MNNINGKIYKVIDEQIITRLYRSGDGKLTSIVFLEVWTEVDNYISRMLSPLNANIYGTPDNKK